MKVGNFRKVKKLLKNGWFVYTGIAGLGYREKTGYYYFTKAKRKDAVVKEFSSTAKELREFVSHKGIVCILQHRSYTTRKHSEVQ